MTDDELLKVYDEGFEGAVVAQESHAEAFSAALRAVFLAGARAQREMKPTEAMLEAGVEAWDAHASGVRELVDLDGTLLEIVKAMQRVAPLVGGEE